MPAPLPAPEPHLRAGSLLPMPREFLDESMLSSAVRVEVSEGRAVIGPFAHPHLSRGRIALLLVWMTIIGLVPFGLRHAGLLATLPLILAWGFAVFCPVFAAVLVVLLRRQEREDFSRGPLLVCDRSAGVLRAPRARIEIPIGDLLELQIIQGVVAQDHAPAAGDWFQVAAVIRTSDGLRRRLIAQLRCGVDSRSHGFRALELFSAFARHVPFAVTHTRIVNTKVRFRLLERTGSLASDAYTFSLDAPPIIDPKYSLAVTNEPTH